MSLDSAAAFAIALDSDDFDALLAMLDDDVVYRIGTEEHHGPRAVVASYRSGSELARPLFDRVEFSHRIVGSGGSGTANDGDRRDKNLDGVRNCVTPPDDDGWHDGCVGRGAGGGADGVQRRRAR